MSLKNGPNAFPDSSTGLERCELEIFSRSRRQFHMPQDETGQLKTYLCGNSLGLQPKAATERIEKELTRWARFGIDGYFEGKTAWVRYADLCAPHLARLTGSGEDEVALMNSLTTNLHLLMAGFYRPKGKKRKILIEQQAFPSDHYAVASQLRWHGCDPAESLIVLEPDNPGPVFSTGHVCAAIRRHAHELAMVLLPAVQYVSGQVLAVAEITRCAHENDVLIGWDCAHAAGNVPLYLHDWQVDFAVGCSYKYLNGGPGAPGWAFVHRRHHTHRPPALTGWWGNHPDSRFIMAPDFEPASGISAWQLSNVPVLAAAAALAGLESFADVPLEALRRQSLCLHHKLREVLQAYTQVGIITPAEPEQHGCQLAFGLHTGRDATRALFEHLLADGIVGDWREPGIIRLSPVPLYNHQQDIEKVAQSLARFFAGS